MITLEAIGKQRTIAYNAYKAMKKAKAPEDADRTERAWDKARSDLATMLHDRQMEINRKVAAAKRLTLPDRKSQ